MLGVKILNVNLDILQDLNNSYLLQGVPCNINQSGNDGRSVRGTSILPMHGIVDVPLHDRLQLLVAVWHSNLKLLHVITQFQN